MPSKTVIVTGASGFIAKHILVSLLNAGYKVRGTIRSLDRSSEIIAAVKPHIDASVDLEGALSFVALDLTKDDGWQEAMAGGDVLLHTASPFPMGQPDDENALIRPAVDGTLRAFKAAHAAGIKRAVLTSSMAAVMNNQLPEGKTAYDETCWTDIKHPTASPYDKSKTMAERAAWDYVQNTAPEMALTTINPGLVFGPSLDAHFGTSLQILENMLRGKDKAVPDISIPIIDVRDVATMHLKAVQNDASIGKRCFGSAKEMSFPEIAQTLAKAYPDRPIVTRVAPKFMVRMIAAFRPDARAILPIIGLRRPIDTSLSRRVLEMEFMSAEDSVLAGAQSVLKHRKL